MTLKADIGALRLDAGVWANVARVTNTAATAADRLTLGESQLSWASSPTGLLHTYEEIRAKVSRLLSEATANFNALSVTLDQIATDYETNDAQAAQQLRGVWDPRP